MKPEEGGDWSFEVSRFLVVDSPSFPGNFYWRAYVHREQAAVALSLRGDDTPDCARISDHGVTPDGGALSPDVPKRRDGVARRSRLGYALCPGRTTPELCGPRASASDATSSQPSRPTPRWRWTPLSEFVSFSLPSSAPLFIAQEIHQRQQIPHISACSNFQGHFCCHDRMNHNGRNIRSRT